MFGKSQKAKDAYLDDALESLDADRVRKALERGASPNRMAGQRNGGPLVKAVQFSSEPKSLEVVTLLLEKGANPNEADSDGETILHYLLKWRGGHLSVLNKMLEAGADVTAAYGGATPLWAAVANKAWEAAGTLLAYTPGQPLPVIDGRSLLTLAVENGAPVTLLDKLAGAKVDVNVCGGKGTALHAAIAGGRAASFNWLLERQGLDLNAVDGEGRTPLLSAIQGGKKDMAGSLVQAGANPALADNAGTTPLLAAVRAGKRDLVEMLLAGGADPAQPDADRVSPLMAAADGGHTQIVERLILAGADVDAADRAGCTPLMKAAASGDMEALAALVKAGASTEAEDLQGLKAYDHATSAGKTQNREFLKRFRHETPATAGSKAASPENRYTRLNDFSIEVRESPNLSIIFNFWMGQVIYRDPSQPSPVVVQSFTEVPRQEAVNEAYKKLKALGGNPPEPAIASFQKRPQGLGKG